MTRLRCVLEERGRDLTWTVIENDRTQLQMYGLRIADGTMDLIAHCPVAASTDGQLEAWRTILAEVVGVANARGIRELRCLVRNEFPVVPLSILGENGFAPTVELQEWTAAGASSTRPDPSIRHLPLDEGLAGFGRQSLSGLVSECLAGSHDLLRLSRPSPETLLETWSRLTDAELFLAGDEGRQYGLAILTRAMDGDSGWSAALEYLGVAESRRRQRWARRLLAQVLQAACPDSGPTSADLVTWCDTENLPAVRLYQAEGFAPGEMQTIWWRRLMVQDSTD